MSLLTKIYGRRRGRKLHKSQQERIDELLPELTITLPENGKIDLSEFAGSEVWLEIGSGAGEHMAHRARQNPYVNFIASEVFYNGVSSLVGHIDRLGIENVAIFPDDARLILKKIPTKSISRVFMLFPDPWPKRKHNKRRLLSKTVLHEIARVIKPGCEFRVATDDESYAEWIFELMQKEGLFEGPIGNIHEPPEDWIETRYHQRAQLLGHTCYFFSFIRSENNKKSKDGI